MHHDPDLAQRRPVALGAHERRPLPSPGAFLAGERLASPTRRAAGRAVVGVLVLLAVTSSVALYAVPGPARTLLANVSWTAAAGVAVIGTLIARRRVQSRARQRSTGLMLAATVSWLLAQLWWDAVTLARSPGPSPNVADAGWFAFAGFTVLAYNRRFPLTHGVRSLAQVETALLSTAVTLGV